MGQGRQYELTRIFTGEGAKILIEHKVHEGAKAQREEERARFPLRGNKAIEAAAISQPGIETVYYNNSHK